MLSSNYNLLTLQNLEPSETYFDKLPKDLVWYMLGYTGPQDGYIVLKKPYFNRGPITIEKCSIVHTKEELSKRFSSPMYYGPQYLIEKVKFVYIDGKQYAAVPIKGKIEGFTPPKQPKPTPDSSSTSNSKFYRCIGHTLSGSRCKNKTSSDTKKCAKHLTKII